jgi:hypothetical protein
MTNTAYQAGDYVMIGKGKRGMILNFAGIGTDGLEIYNVRTACGDIIMSSMFIV